MKFRVDLDTFLSNREVPAKYIILSSAFVFFFLCALVTSFATDNYAAIMMGIVSGIIAWSLSREIKQLRDKEQLLHFQKGISANGFDATMFAFFIFSPSGKCIFLNNVAQHLFPGFNVRTIEDLSICFGKYPKIVDAINDLKIATNNMKQSHIDVPFTLNKGNTVLWRISVSPIPNYTGYSGWSIIDLTPSNSRIESFDTDPCFLLDVINRSYVGFFTIDINEKIIFCNKILSHWCGDRELIGRHYSELMTEDLHDIDSSTESILKDMPIKVHLISNDPNAVDNTIVKKILRDGDGNETYIVTKEAQQADELIDALNKTKLYFEHIFEDAPVGIIITEGAETISSCNHAFENMVDKQNIQGTSFIDYIADDQKESVRKSLYKIISEIYPSSAPFEIRFNANAQRVVTVFVSKIDESKRTKANDGLILYLIDITAQKALQEQFVQSQKMQAVGQLAGGIAHDFNNLLTAMIGYCDLLLEKFLPSDRSFNDIMQIKQNANRASNLVRQLLAFSRQQNMQPKILDVNEMLSELSALLKRLLGAKIELKVSHKQKVGSIKVDQIQFEQVIINLAVNARDAMKNGGTLSISTSVYDTEEPKILRGDTMPPGSYILIEVEDTGCGINEKYLERIFDPFFSTKEKGHGTGLGLATVYGIVHQTEGFISVESKINVGTKFCLYFKRVSENEIAQNQQSQKSEHKIVDLTGSGTILLVEDEDAVRVFGARALRDKGYKVIEAPDGEAATAFLKQHGNEIDLVISDVVMPKMDGPTLMKYIHEHNPNMKVIFISGYAEDNFRESLAHDASVHFLAKPFNLKQLATKVKEVL